MDETVIADISQKKAALYGPYDCVHNAVIHLLAKGGRSLTPIYCYNWDMIYNEKYDKLSGSLEPSDLFRFVRQVYPVQIEHISFEDIFQTQQDVLIIVSLYDIPYSKFYHRIEQDHCVIARRIAINDVEVVDPYFGAVERVSAERLHDTWKKYKDWIYSWNWREEGRLDNLGPFVPFLSAGAEDSEQKYAKAMKFAHLMLQVNTMKENKQTYIDRYFGMINSIYVARQNHFTAINDHQNDRVAILSGWMDVQKMFLKYQYDFISPDIFISKIERVFEAEQSYLDNLS